MDRELVKYLIQREASYVLEKAQNGGVTVVSKWHALGMLAIAHAAGDKELQALANELRDKIGAVDCKVTGC